MIRGRVQEDLRQRIGPQHSGRFQPRTRWSEQRTVDHFWEMDKPTPTRQRDMPGPSAAPTRQHTRSVPPNSDRRRRNRLRDGPRPVHSRSSCN